MDSLKSIRNVFVLFMAFFMVFQFVASILAMSADESYAVESVFADVSYACDFAVAYETDRPPPEGRLLDIHFNLKAWQ